MILGLPGPKNRTEDKRSASAKSRRSQGATQMPSVPKGPQSADVQEPRQGRIRKAQRRTVAPRWRASDDESMESNDKVFWRRSRIEIDTVHNRCRRNRMRHVNRSRYQCRHFMAVHIRRRSDYCGNGLMDDRRAAALSSHALAAVFRRLIIHRLRATVGRFLAAATRASQIAALSAARAATIPFACQATCRPANWLAVAIDAYATRGYRQSI